MSFDPERVRFEKWGVIPEDSRFNLTPAVALHYHPGGRAFPHLALPGLRYKYPFRADGFIIKAEVFPDSFLDGGLPMGFGQAQSEWLVWESLPDSLRPYFAPILCMAYQRLEGSFVIWTAQQWVQSAGVVHNKECRALEQRMRQAGYRIHDGGAKQMMRPAGWPHPVFVDWGHWACPKKPSRNRNESATLSVPPVDDLP